MNPTIKKFTHDGKEYEIRAAAFDDGYQAAVFQGGKKLCENVKISFDDDHDAAYFTGARGLDWLFRALEEEVRRGALHG